jgi:xanthine dehydrogenase accessory factor
MEESGERVADLAREVVESGEEVACLVDAIMAKRNTGTRITDARRVIALGPGFTAGVDCHFVVETRRGHNLGRVIGPQDTPPHAEPNTGVPGNIGGFTSERLIRAPAGGAWDPLAAIGEKIENGAAVARVGGAVVSAAIGGVVRGMLPAGYPVTPGMKCGDIDPRPEALSGEYWRTVSDKALSVAGGVLEAALRSVTA